MIEEFHQSKGIDVKNPLTAMWFGRLGNRHYGVLLIAFWIASHLIHFVMPYSWQTINLLTSFVIITIFSGIIARRLHDFGQSGKWAFLSFVPFVFLFLGVGSLVGLTDLFVSLIKLMIVFIPGTAGRNAYGDSPKESPSLRTLLFGL